MMGLAAIVAATAFTTQASAQTELATIVANDVAAGDNAGNAVDVSGNTAIMGAYKEGGPEVEAGAAYIFVNGISGWTQQARLVSPNRSNGDGFGFSVAIDGNVAVVGAPFDTVLGTGSGAAYVFRRVAGVWGLPVTLVGTGLPARANGDRFGCAVTIEGNRIVVGADQFFTSGVGRAYVFEFDGVNWNQTASLTPSGSAIGPRFGGAVAVSSNTVAIGAIGDDGPGNSVTNCGAVHVFTGSGTWSLQAILRAGPSDISAGAFFGFSVALSGNTAAIGATQDGGTGAVYVTERTGTVWSIPAGFTSISTGSGNQLGCAVAVDGDILAAGARLGSGGFGHVALFRRVGGSWLESSCTLIPTLAAGADQYGTAVALDGTTILAGAPGNDLGGSEAGSATFFKVVAAGDTDGDGLTDDEEACIAHALGGSCPNPLDPDSDDDGLSDWHELNVSSTDLCFPDNPGGGDSDNDGVPDATDNCPSIANTDQANFDGDNAGGDACDLDDDNDGLNDLDEVTFGSNPFDFDSDNDTLNDGVEFGLGTNPNSSDSDGDLLSDAIEAPLGCPHPTIADSDDDGIQDGFESNAGWDPCDADTDGDGLADGDEDGHGTGVLDPDSDDDGLFDGAEVALAVTQPCVDPMDPDSDNDGIIDGDEVTAGSGPCDLDSDDDGLADGLEAGHGTSVMNPDCDSDDLLDGAEVDSGCSDPLNPDTDGDTLLDGDEAEAGTSPCNSDTDGDTLADNTDNDPLEFSATVLATMTLSARDTAQNADVGEYFGPNNNVRTVRRTILGAQITLAAAAIEHGNYGAAEALLTLSLSRVDGDTPPADWMTDGSDKTHLRNDLIELIEIINLIN